MRINLDVGAETHPMVLTSGYDQQFGISISFAEEALNQSDLIKSKVNLNRIGVIVGSGIGGIHALEKQHNRLLKKLM